MLVGYLQISLQAWQRIVLKELGASGQVLFGSAMADRNDGGGVLVGVVEGIGHGRPDSTR